jgi:GT2 family glycosyltransferase
MDRNRGFAAGYNIALGQIDAEYYVLLNSDIEVTTGWLNTLVEFMDERPDAAACQPKIRSWQKREYFEYGGAAGGYIDRYGYPFCRGRIFGNVEKDNGQYDTVAEVFWTSGSCMIIRSEAWKRCSGLDPDFFAHMEEIDLCWRLLLCGYHLYYIPQSVVYHVGGGALPYDSPFKTYLNFRNNLFLLYKNLPPGNMHMKLFLRKALDGVAAGFFILSGRFRAVREILRAHIDYYKSSGTLKAKRELVERTVPGNPARLTLNKSIVFEFYIKGNKSFDKLGCNF